MEPCVRERSQYADVRQSARAAPGEEEREGSMVLLCGGGDRNYPLRVVFDGRPVEPYSGRLQCDGRPGVGIRRQRAVQADLVFVGELPKRGPWRSGVSGDGVPYP